MSTPTPTPPPLPDTKSRLHRNIVALLETRLSTLYDKYCTYYTHKTSTTSTPLSFDDYLAFHTHTKLPTLWLDHPGLAFAFLKSDLSTRLVPRHRFVRVAPAFGSRLADAYDAGRVFDALVHGHAAGELSQASFNQYASATRDLLSERHAHLSAPGAPSSPLSASPTSSVRVARASSATSPWEAWCGRTRGLVDVSEQLLWLETRVTKGVKALGELCLTSRHLVFRGFVSSQIVLAAPEVVSVEATAERGLSIAYVAATGAEMRLDLYVGAKGTSLPRDRLVAVIHSWIECHRFSEQHGLAGHAVLFHSLRSLGRMQALSRLPQVDLDTFKMTLPSLVSLHELHARLADLEPDDPRRSASMLQSIASAFGVGDEDVQLTSKSIEHGFDPEFDVISADILAGARVGVHAPTPSPPSSPSTSTSASKSKSKTKQDLSLSGLLTNMGALKDELMVVGQLSSFFESLVMWENPWATFFLVWFLLDLSYRDTLQYLPAFAVYMHALFILLLRIYPSGLERVLHQRVVSDADRDADGDPLSDPIAEPSSAELAELSSASARQSEEAHSWAIFNTFRNVKNTIVRSKASLANAQNWFHDQTIQVRRAKGLYTWRRSHGFLALSLGACLGMLVLPYRWLHVAMVLSIFTERFHMDDDGLLVRLMRAVPVQES